ncbi:MAG: hypothetical protein A2139_02360 [Desulfobacca sp. RBG_16_60_12]|nr:MAG: hypothetical protein A2139_02360 [Desulfobacca sp. RBG_16_60_12]
MRKLLVLLAGLLLAAPALGVSIKGQLSHCAYADISAGTCTPATRGALVYDTTNSVSRQYVADIDEWVYFGTKWASLNANTPRIDFNDINEATYDTFHDAAIYVNCLTQDECGMQFSTSSNAVATSTNLELYTFGAAEGGAADGETQVLLGRNLTLGTNAWANTHTYASFTEGGNLSFNNASPTISFYDSSMAGDEATSGVGAQIILNCPTGTTAGNDEDCDLDFKVGAAGTLGTPIRVDTTDSGVQTVQIGDGGAANYLSIGATGYTVGVGTSIIMAPRDVVQICGENTTINNNTVYYGPDITLVSNTSGLTCDINAVGNVDEATADAPAFTNKAVQVTGMTCRNEADSGASISYTLRTAAGATVPSVTCTIDGTGAAAERDCVADVQTTTAIAAGATLAIAAASTSDIADANGFICNVQVAY